MQKHQQLCRYAKSMPMNANCTSPQIQNDVNNDIMARMLQDVVVKESDIGHFCIKCDESRDSTNTEDMSIVVRYVTGGVAVERLLCLVDTKAVDAQSTTDAIIRQLTYHGLILRKF